MRKILFLVVAMSLCCGMADSRIVTVSGYEGLLQGKPGCHKIWVMVYDMSTMPDGTQLAKKLGMGYFIPNPCEAANDLSTASCRKIARQDALIYNHPSETSACVADLIRSNEAVARAFDDAGRNALHELKKARFSSAPIDAVFNRDSRVLQLRLYTQNRADTEYSLSMTNSSGKEIYAQSCGNEPGATRQYFVDVRDLPKGAYQLALSRDRKMLSVQDIVLD